MVPEMSCLMTSCRLPASESRCGFSAGCMVGAWWVLNEVRLVGGTQVEGLHSTTATRAGFLAEVTAVLTPLVSYLAGYDIPRQMWLAVGVGLIGSTMVAYDTSQVGEGPYGLVVAV